MDKKVYMVKITSCNVPTAWYAPLVGSTHECYEWGKDYVLKQDYDAGDHHWWRHITKDDCVVVDASDQSVQKKFIGVDQANGEDFGMIVEGYWQNNEFHLTAEHRLTKRAGDGHSHEYSVTDDEFNYCVHCGEKEKVM